MIVVSCWDIDGDEELVEAYRRLGIPASFFVPQPSDLYSGFDMGCRPSTMDFQPFGNGFAYPPSHGYPDEALTIRSLGFSYGRIGVRWQFALDKVDPYLIPVHVDYDSDYFWNIYTGSRRFFIFRGTKAPDIEDRLHRMLDNSDEFWDMQMLVDRLSLRNRRMQLL